MESARATALRAHSVALSSMTAGDVGATDGLGGGLWSRSERERLFTVFFFFFPSLVWEGLGSLQRSGKDKGGGRGGAE